jgi:hypothetical protein
VAVVTGVPAGVGVGAMVGAIVGVGVGVGVDATLGVGVGAITLNSLEACEGKYPGGAVLSSEDVADSVLMPGEPSVTWQLATPR